MTEFPMQENKLRLVDWDPKFETGLESVDEQHRFLFNVINQHFNAMQESKGIAEISRTLIALKRYAQFHFDEEEQLMQHHHYSRLHEHFQLHQIFVEKVAEMEQRELEGSFLVSIEVLRFMKDWIANHIEVEDMEFGAFVKKTGDALLEHSGNLCNQTECGDR